MKRYIVAASVAALGFAGLAQAISLNEVRIDHGGSDTDEYFEISGNAGESLDGLWYIVIGDHSADQGAGGNGSRSGNVEYALSLTGSTIPADGFFLAATASFGTGGLVGSVDLTAALKFENSDNVTHMIVRDFTGAEGDALDTGTPDGILDIMPWSAVIDALSLVEDLTPDFSSEEFSYGGQFGGGATDSSLGPDGTFVPGHAYRTLDGKSAWAVGDFGLANGPGPFDTPGASNIPTPGAFALLGLAGLAGTRRRR